MDKKVSAISLFSLLLLSSLMFSATIPTVLAQPTDLKHLVVDTIGEPMDLDPAWSYDTASAELLMNVYETLLWFNRTKMDEYVPVLATDWVGVVIDETSPEGLTWKNRWTFTIRDGVCFHDTCPTSSDIPGAGSLLKPSDVEYTFERMLITDCSTGPAWMIWEPLIGGYWMGDLNATMTDLGWPINATTGWNTKCDEAIDHAIESDNSAMTVTFNLVMPYEPWLQIVAQQWGSVLSQDWCRSLGNRPGDPADAQKDWPGMEVGDDWYLYWDPAASPIYQYSTLAPGPHLDCALGTGPYIFDYWNTGAGGAWSVVKNDPEFGFCGYWRGWDVPYTPPGFTEPQILGHVERYTSNYIPEWPTRRLRFVGGVADFCAVPRMYMDEVEGQPGIDCYWPLPELACGAAFYTFLVSDTSSRIGVVQANDTFSSAGAPPNIFNYSDIRLGLAHAFNYTAYIEAAYLNEAISPVTPIVPGLAYYDPNIGKSEDPSISQTKEYGITGELAGQKAFDLALAADYLDNVAGLWANGFTMDFVYNEGNLMREMACRILADGLQEITASYGGPTFTINVVSVPWSVYKLEWKAHNLPFFIVGWLADYPDAHNFAHPFMHSIGAFSRWQGYMDVTEFPSHEIDEHIEKGIGTIIPAERQSNYTWLQQEYVDMCPSMTLHQPTGRHWQRDWVQGWYYNPIYPGEYVYDLWKEIGTVEPLDLAVTDIALTYPDCPGCPEGLCVCLCNTWNETIYPVLDFDITIERLDVAGPFSGAIVGLTITDSAGYLQVVDIDIIGTTAGMAPAVVSLFWNASDISTWPADCYTVNAEVLPISPFVYDTDLTNNALVDGKVLVYESCVSLDYDGNCRIDGVDHGRFCFFYAEFQRIVNPVYHFEGDTDCDGIVDGVDLGNFCRAYVRFFACCVP